MKVLPFKPKDPHYSEVVFRTFSISRQSKLKFVLNTLSAEHSIPTSLFVDQSHSRRLLHVYWPVTLPSPGKNTFGHTSPRL